MYVLALRLIEEPAVWWNNCNIVLIIVILKGRGEEENPGIWKWLIFAKFCSPRTSCKLKTCTLANEHSLMSWDSWIMVYFVVQDHIYCHGACLGTEK